jgi:hypothetical protein
VVFFTLEEQMFLKKVDDPLKIPSFFPCPAPLTYIESVSSMQPIPPYRIYQQQAQELNDVSQRITKIIRAMKVRGFYDSTLEGLSDLMSSEDNTLLPAQNVAAMLNGQTLDRAIWLFPIERLVAVLQQLYLQRNQIKSVIYEITGQSDIQRGAVAASESATASGLKDKWGSLRLKDKQQEVENYVRDTLRVIAAIVCEQYEAQTFQQITQIQLPDAEMKMKAQQAMAIAQQSGQPPPPGMEAALALPTWGEVVAFLREDKLRNYMIDVETASTRMPDAQADKEEVSEFMNAFSQLLNGLQPMVESGYLDFEVAKVMMMAVVKRFDFGGEIEAQLERLKAPAPAQPEGDPKAKEALEKERAQLDEERNRVKLETIQMKLQADFDKQLRQIQQRFDDVLQKVQRERAQERATTEINAAAQASQQALREESQKQALAQAETPELSPEQMRQIVETVTQNLLGAQNATL